MPQSDNQVEANELPSDVEADLDAALEKAGVDVKSEAAAEERRTAELIAKSREMQEEPAEAQPAQDESLVSIMAQGREHLMERMRAHAREAEAKKQAYKPPPLTERQLSALEEEQAAGRRARERHERELANRPPPPAKEKWDGSNTPVFRPDSIVPDPTIPATSGFVAGRGQFDEHGATKVIVPQ
jgi:hypothetical protein